MYIVVKFGEQERAIFNPNCRTVSLLEDIKYRCRCGKEADVDLSDETGNVKNLREAPTRYASEILGDKGTFVLLKVEKKEDTDSDPQFTPLLNDSAAITEGFLARLASKEEKLTVNLGRRRSSIAPSSGRKSSLKESAKSKLASLTATQQMTTKSGKVSPGTERRGSKSKQGVKH